MCGICGYINYSNQTIGTETADKMVHTLHHRGPDASGTYYSYDGQLCLGHSRLSIIDVSNNGRQPMEAGHLVIVFNGEIYNYKEIKEILYQKGHRFVSDSDTEVILHAYQEWGNNCVAQFIGIFAFVIYDRKEETITLFRDRAGVKPLYYYEDESSFIFASELKAFHQYPLFEKQIDERSIQLYLQFGYIPTPYCIFNNAHKLKQGCYLIHNRKTRQSKIECYWNLKDYYEQPKLSINYSEAVDEVERLLIESFNYRMVSDVPVGVFLSSGYDSTCVAALLQKARSERIKTYTIGFGQGNNEAPCAKEISDLIGTEHTEYFCGVEDALKIIDELPYYFDEPFADSSAIPTLLVSRMAKQDVTVALSADGGDEIFGGYKSYDFFVETLNRIYEIPRPLFPLAKFSAKALMHFPLRQSYKEGLGLYSRVLSAKGDLAQSILREQYNRDEMIRKLMNRNVISYPIVYDEDLTMMEPLSMMMYSDYIQYMQDDILVKVDRCTMGASLEGRDPFLDQHIIEFVSRLPDEYKYGGGTKKKILKDIVHRYVPKTLMDRPKAGFSVPLAQWLTEGLKDQVAYYLSDKSVLESSIISMAGVKEIRRLFTISPEEYKSDLWKILQFQMWYDRWMKAK